MPFKWPVKRRSSKGKNANEASKDDMHNGGKDNDGIDKEQNDNCETDTAADVESTAQEEPSHNVDNSGSKTNRRNASQGNWHACR